MFKRFIKDSAIYGVSNILAKGVSFLLIPLYTRALSPSELGVSDLAITFVTLLSLTLPLEISQGLFRLLPDNKAHSVKAQYISTAFWFVISIFILFLIFSLPFSSQISSLIFKSDTQNILVVVAFVMIIFVWLNTLLMISIRSLMRSLEYSVVSLITTIFTIIMTVVCVLVLKIGALGVIIGYFTGYLAGSVLSIYFLRKQLLLFFDFAKLKEMLHYSIPLIPSSVGYYSTLYVNRIMISIYLSTAEVGLYAIAYKLMTPITLIMNSASFTLAPILLNSYKNKSAPGEIVDVFRFLFSLCFLIVTALSIFSKEITHLFTTPGYYAASTLIPILSFTALLEGLNLFAIGLVIAKKTPTLAAINIFSGILNVFLNFLLIPRFGILGSGVATLLAIMVNLYLNMYLSQKHYFVPFKWKPMALAFTSAIVLIALSMLFRQMDLISILIKTGFLILEIAFLFVFKMISKNDFDHFSIKKLLVFIREITKKPLTG